jgi:hypothetical protein
MIEGYKSHILAFCSNYNIHTLMKSCFCHASLPVHDWKIKETKSSQQMSDETNGMKIRRTK